MDLSCFEDLSCLLPESLMDMLDHWLNQEQQAGVMCFGMVAVLLAFAGPFGGWHMFSVTCGPIHTNNTYILVGMEPTFLPCESPVRNPCCEIGRHVL